MKVEDFEALTNKLVSHVKFLYFHLMGEPFVHPQLAEFIHIARRKSFIPIITTNGTLLHSADEIINAHPYKVQISLHSHEANDKYDLQQYMNAIIEFSKKASHEGIIIVLRLWNEGGYNQFNPLILDMLTQSFPTSWEERKDGWKITDHVYLEYDKMFEWPNDTCETSEAENVFCYALRNQIGILVDGSVVPCCLDHSGCLTLGNLFEQSLSEILESPRAKAIYDGFTRHIAVEPFCQNCGYATKTKQYRN